MSDDDTRLLVTLLEKLIASPQADQDRIIYRTGKGLLLKLLAGSKERV